jgi:glycosyltransferase involved in cell wall biosynthesis
MPIRALRAFFRSHYERARSSSLESRLDEVDREWKPDVIHAEELRMGFYLPAFRGRRTNALQSITLHNVESCLYRQIGASGGSLFGKLQHWLQSRSLVRYEGEVIRAANLVFAYSPVDLERYRALYPAGNWRMTRNGTDARHIPACAPAARNTLLFVGTLSYAPNVRGLWWLLDKVWPRLCGKYSLTVAGSGANQRVRDRLSESRIRFVDAPQDLTPLYRDNALCLVPLFEGGGSRGRVLEACAHKRLVITTTLGLEGLDLAPGAEGVIVADDPESYANAIEYWSAAADDLDQAAARGRAAVVSRYDWSVVAAELVSNWSSSSLETSPSPVPESFARCA